MKIGDLVYLNGTKREIQGIIITVDIDYSKVFWHTGKLSWESNGWLEVVQ